MLRDSSQFTDLQNLRLSNKTSIHTAFDSSASGGALALLTAKGEADVGATSAVVFSMVGTMTIITSFLSPYIVKFGLKIGDKFGLDLDEQKRADEQGSLER